MFEKFRIYYWHIRYEVCDCIACDEHWDEMTVIADTVHNAFDEMRERIYNEFDYDFEDIGEINIRKGELYAEY